METGTDLRLATDLLAQSSKLDDVDRRLSHAAATPIYALDSNVAIFLSRPIAEARPAQRSGVARVGFGTIFQADPEEASDIVAQALAAHLFVELRRFGPMLMIPPVAGELQQFALGLAREHMVPKPEEEKGWRGKAEQFLAKLQRHRAYDAEAERLVQLVQRALSLHHGPAGALRRLRRMLDRGDIISADALATQSHIDDRLIAALAPPTRVLDLVRASVDARTWVGRGLEATVRRSGAVHRDGYALARLRTANAIMQDRGDPFRIVYVSADRNLLETVERVDDPLVLAVHPRAWIPRLPIFERAHGYDMTSLADLLRLSVRAGSGSHETTQSDFATTWTTYLETATTAFLPEEAARPLYLDTVPDLIDRFTVELERFEAELVGLEEQAWEDCFDVSARTAVAEVGTTEPAQVRQAPPLMFEDWTATQQTVASVASWRLGSSMDVGLLERSIEAINEEDPTGYARYLTYGVVFAGRGEWRLAGSLARRASERVRPDGAASGAPNGRESSFLEAVCRRRYAASPDDLADSAAVLYRAIEIEERERSAGRSWDVVPERFEVEMLLNKFAGVLIPHNGRRNHSNLLETFAAGLIAPTDDLLRRVEVRAAEERDGSAALVSALGQTAARTTLLRMALAVLTREAAETATPVWSLAKKYKLLVGAKRLDYVDGLVVLAMGRLIGENQSEHWRRRFFRGASAAEKATALDYALAAEMRDRAASFTGYNGRMRPRQS